ncbi:hypothetical protein ABZ801_10680 [Actinomadura sp. NPDC047616]|uniref:hypothetical protein n=1 Tax=Actinomadura sp. NPDC047616 TaxID=3155914 RepID=UPI0033CBC2E0
MSASEPVRPQHLGGGLWSVPVPIPGMFTGDHVLPRITPHIGLYPYDRPDVDPLGDFLASLRRVAGLPAAERAEVPPAHQHRFTGLAERAHAIIGHHEDRLAEVAALLGAEPVTLWQVAAGLRWRSPWEAMAPADREMAAGEAAAHLRTLERRGVARRDGADAPIRFVRAAAA